MAKQRQEVGDCEEEMESIKYELGKPVTQCLAEHQARLEQFRAKLEEIRAERLWEEQEAQGVLVTEQEEWEILTCYRT